MSLVQELLIKIGIKADTAQANQAADAVARTGKSAEQAGEGLKDVGRGSSEAAEGLGKTVAVGNATSQLLNSLKDVSFTSASGWMAVGKSILHFGTVVKATLLATGPVGIAIAVIGSLIGVVLLLKDAFGKGGESAEEMEKRIAALNKAKLDGVTAQQKALEDAAKDALTAIDQELAALDKLADMRTARLIEEEKARGKERGADPAITERNITRIRRDAEDAKIGRDLSAADRKARTLEDAASEAEHRRSIADLRRTQLLGLKVTYDQLAEQEEAARKEMLKGYLKRGYALPEENERLAALQKERDAARAALEKRLGGSDPEGKIYADTKATADAEVTKLTEASQAATKAAEAATAAAEAARKLEGDLAPERSRMRSAEDRSSAADSPEAKAARDERRRKEVAAMQQTPESAWRERAAAGWTVDQDLFKAAFPKAKPLPGRRLPTDSSPAAGAGGLQEQAASVSESASKTESAVKEQAAQLEKVASGAATIATSQESLLGSITGMVTAQLAAATTQEQANSAIAGALDAVVAKLAEHGNKIRAIEQRASAARARASSAS